MGTKRSSVPTELKNQTLQSALEGLKVTQIKSYSELPSVKTVMITGALSDADILRKCKQRWEMYPDEIYVLGCNVFVVEPPLLALLEEQRRKDYA